MRQCFLLVLAILLIISLPAQTYITHVNLVDVVNLKTETDATVEIYQDKIIAVGKSNVIAVPEHATVIDATGKYLIPGLTDAHVHFFQSGGLYTRPDFVDLRKYHSYDSEIVWAHQHFDDMLRRYLASGITTVIDPGSTINFLIQRDSFKNKTYAPDIYMTGPLLTTYEPDEFKGLNNDDPFYLMQTEDEARKYVDKELPYKPDFIKIWYIVGRNVDSSAKASSHLVKAVIDEAHKNHLKVAVHATQKITAQLAVEDGADYLVHSVDDKIIDDDFIRLLKEHHIILCPTLQVMDNYKNTFTLQYQPTAADKAIANPEALASLQDIDKIQDTTVRNDINSVGKHLTTFAASADPIMATNLKKLVDAGIPIATGTDAGNIGTQHASSFFKEIELMQQAGMSIPQILQASTINCAKALGKETTFGSIEKGKVANLVLLNADPFQNLDNWRNIGVIINKGVVLKPSEIMQQ